MTRTVVVVQRRTGSRGEEFTRLLTEGGMPTG
jgi:hypothetical protein